MKTTKSQRVLLTLHFFIILVTLAGCGGTSSSSSGNGRSLSEVMTKKDAEEQEETERRRREGETRTRTHSEPVVKDSSDRGSSDSSYSSSGNYDSSSDYESARNTASVLSFLFNVFFSGNEEQERGEAVRDVKEEGEQKSGSKYWAGYRHSWSRFAGDAITGFETSTLMFGLRGRNGNLGYVGLYFGNGTTGRSDLDETITNLDEMGLELGLKIYITPSRSRMGGYIETGLRFGEIAWNYRDPSLGPSEDYLGEWGPFLGFGVAILQTRHLHLGASVMGGVWFMGDETGEGFNNDVFKDVGYYQVNLKGVILF